MAPDCQICGPGFEFGIFPALEGGTCQQSLLGKSAGLTLKLQVDLHEGRKRRRNTKYKTNIKREEKITFFSMKTTLKHKY